MRLVNVDDIPYLYPVDEDGNEGDGMTLKSTIDELPTVEAYTKDEIENMLLEIANKIVDKSWNIDMYNDDLDFECCYLSDVEKFIQEKINELRGNRNERS